MSAVEIREGDCLDVLRAMPECSVDTVVTDPPYGLEFMGKEWDKFGDVTRANRGTQLDRARPPGESGTSPKHQLPAPAFDLSPRALHGYQAWCEAWAAECLRVLKPGGHLLAFGGTRTWHRLACAVEDAGFELRDSIAWLYGSGFPKSLDVGKAIDAYHLTGGRTNSRAIRQANDSREVIGSKIDLPGKSAGQTPNSGGFTNIETHVAPIQDADNRARRLGAPLADGGHRRDLDITAPATDDARTWQGWGTALKPAHEPIVVARKPLVGTVAGNVLAHGTGALNVDASRVGSDTGRGDRHNGKAPLGGGAIAIAGTRPEPWDVPAGRWPANVLLDGDAADELDAQSGALHTQRPTYPSVMRSSHFGAANESTRQNHYDDSLASQGASRFFPTFRYQAKAPTSERPKLDGKAHPTVKPLALMRWLVRLVTPPGGLVLDPFAGSGTTGEACLLEGFRCLLIEREPDYLPLIRARLAKHDGTLDLGAAS